MLVNKPVRKFVTCIRFGVFALFVLFHSLGKCKLKWVFFFLLILRYRIQYMYIDVESSNCFNCFFLLGPTFFLLGPTFWPTWSNILTYLVLHFDLLGPTVWPTWYYILTYLVLQFDLLGPTFWCCNVYRFIPHGKCILNFVSIQKIKLSNPIHV